MEARAGAPRAKPRAGGEAAAAPSGTLEHALLAAIEAIPMLPIARGEYEPACAPLSSKARHKLQVAGFVEQLRRADLLGTTSAVVDFGAGYGALSRAVWRAGRRAGHDRRTKYLLVDTRPDREVSSSWAVAHEWLSCDVHDLHVGDLRRSAACGACVALANHLCGGALDTAMRRALEVWGGPDNGGGVHVAAILAATCCHHHTGWVGFLGRHIFVEWGLTEPDFERIRSWSRLAPRRTEPDGGRARVLDVSARLGISVAEAGELGARCRQLMDTARALCLARRGFHVSLVQHADFAATADNVMIRAVASSVPRVPGTEVAPLPVPRTPSDASAGEVGDETPACDSSNHSDGTG